MTKRAVHGSQQREGRVEALGNACTGSHFRAARITGTRDLR